LGRLLFWPSAVALKEKAMTATNTRVLTNQLALRIVARLQHGALRFNALERAVNAPNPVALSQLLKKLQRDGIVIRTVIRLGPPAVTEYALTDLGAGLAAPAGALMAWLDQNKQSVVQARQTSRDRKEADHAAALLTEYGSK
jgi:DNA-binding HxlR family transcriptional regulator